MDRGHYYVRLEAEFIYWAVVLDAYSRRVIGWALDRKGDNAACGSFMKTLKYEEVYRQKYRDLAEAQESIDQFIEEIYNDKRLHSALGYRRRLSLNGRCYLLLLLSRF